jgi:hypothetical protein
VLANRPKGFQQSAARYAGDNLLGFVLPLHSLDSILVCSLLLPITKPLIRQQCRGDTTILDHIV